MNDLLIALLLGTVQGLTEFLPVSSSGHLCLFQGHFGEQWLGDVLFNVSVHLGTTLAVICFFWRDLWALIKGIMPGTFDRGQGRVVLALIITTAITGTIGVLFQESFEALFSVPRFAAAMLLITGVITFLTDRVGTGEREHGEISWKDAILIGLFQSLAILPGISRSGSTIFAGVMSGMERTWAASYSFIAAIPAVCGAVILEWGQTDQAFTLVHLVGAAASFIVGLISLKILVWTLKKHNFRIFSVYCWIVGTGYLIATGI